MAVASGNGASLGVIGDSKPRPRKNFGEWVPSGRRRQNTKAPTLLGERSRDKGPIGWSSGEDDEPVARKEEGEEAEIRVY